MGAKQVEESSPSTLWEEPEPGDRNGEQMGTSWKAHYDLKQHLALLHQLLAMAQAATDLSSFLTALIRKLVERLGVDRGAIALRRGECLEIVAEHRASGGPSALGERIQLREDPLSASVIETGRPLILRDVQDGGSFGSSQPLLQRLGIRSILIVPLIARGQVIGTIGLDTIQQPRLFTKSETDLVQTIAAAAAGFIERMQWLEEAQRRARVLQTLHGILRETTASVELQRFMEGVLTRICAAFDLPLGAIWIGERMVTRGISVDQLAFIFEASRQAQYQLQATDAVPDHEATPPSPLRSALLQAGIRATLSTPIRIREQRIGGLSTGDTRPRPWSAEEISLLEMSAEEIGHAVERIQAFQSLQLFYTLSDALSSLRSPESALASALEAFRAYLGASRICIYRPDPEHPERLIAWSYAGMPLAFLTDSALQEGLVWIRRAFQEGELWLEDLRGQLPAAPYQAFILLLLQTDEDPLGLLEIAWTTPRVFDDSLRSVVKRATQILASGILNIHLWEQLEEHVRQLEAMNRSLEQALIAREQMIQNVSHELRTPLAILQGYLELMSEAALGPLTPDQQEALKIMRERLDGLIRYVELLLALQEIRAGARSLNLLDLRHLVQTACRAYQTRLDPRRHSLHIDVPEHPVWVLGEGQPLLLALSELLENAVKFSPRGGAIRVSLQAQDHEACLQVSDEGIGIPSEALPRVFEPFYQVDGGTTRKFGGMGIGLTAVQRIVEAHRGRIEIQSEAGRGTCVTIWLPVVNPQGGPKKPPTP